MIHIITLEEGNKGNYIATLSIQQKKKKEKENKRLTKIINYKHKGRRNKPSKSGITLNVKH